MPMRQVATLCFLSVMLNIFHCSFVHDPCGFFSVNYSLPWTVLQTALWVRPVRQILISSLPLETNHNLREKGLFFQIS